MEWYLYVLLCDQKIYYVGITNNLERRIDSHLSKKNIATKEFSDLKLIYQEQYPNKHTAARREKQLKGWSSAKKSALVKGNISLLKQLSKS